jgi:hypothetical protein
MRYRDEMTFSRRGRMRSAVALVLATLTLTRAASALAQTPPATPPAAPPPPAPPAGASPAPPPQGGGWAAPYAPPEDQPRDAWGAPLPPGAPGPARSPYAGMIYVELKTDNSAVRIDRYIDGVGQLPVCHAPCRQYLRTDDIYIIGGEGVKTTSRFQLPTDRNAVMLDVKAGSSSKSSMGALFVGLGGALAYIGFIVLEANTVATAAEATNGTTTSSHAGGQVIGLGMTVGGLALLISGIVMVSGSKTTVVSSTGSTFTENARPAPRKRSWVALTPRGLEF